MRVHNTHMRPALLGFVKIAHCAARLANFIEMICCIIAVVFIRRKHVVPIEYIYTEDSVEFLL